MAIYFRCGTCNTDNQIKLRQCRKCNNKTRSKFIVKVKDDSGKWKSKTTPTLQLARRAENKLKVELIKNDGIFEKKVKHKKSTFSFSNYLEYAKLHKVSWRDDVCRWNLHVVDSDYKSPSGIRKLLSSMRDAGKSPQTISHVLKLIRRVYNFHIQEGLWLKDNPTRNIKLPNFDNRVSNILSQDEIKSLISYLNRWSNRRAALVILFAIYTGRRQGEILKLKWQHIDFESGSYTCNNTKNGSNLSFPVNKKALNVLIEAQDILISDYVFPSATGAYFHSFKCCWQRLKKRERISIRFHDLRHTFASHLASSGKVDVYTLKNLLGHKDIKLTERYSHLLDSHLRKSTEVIDSLF